MTTEPILTAAAVLALLIVTALSIQASDTFPASQPLSARGEVGLAVTEREDGDCGPLWYTKRGNVCECGESIHGAVLCNNSTKAVSVLDCYCMTEEAATEQMVVGGCVYNCVNMSQETEYLDLFYHPAPSQCSYLHRRGTLCGECDTENHYYPPAYSYDLECNKCPEPQSWWLYVTVAFLPLTAFIVVILVFRISAVSPALHAFICFAQIAGAPIQVRILILSTKYTLPIFSLLTRIVLALYGIWNLDFFRTLIPGVCLHLTTMEVLALDYLIPVYPMLLMVVAYTLTELHAHGSKPVLLLWKPFHYISARFRREWDIQTSLVDAFVTFFILSGTKLFSVSFDLLIPTTLYVATGDELGTYLYYDPNIKYMKHSSQHLYYGILALTVLLVFFVLPLSLLIFTTCGGCRRVRRLAVVREFLHTFQKYYKDGTNGERDHRWYAGFHHISLFGIYVLYTFVKNGYVYLLAPIYYIVASIIVILIQPYKPEYGVYNTLDPVLCMWQAMFGVSISLLNLSSELQRRFIIPGYISIVFVSFVPLVFISGMVVRWLLKRVRCARCERREMYDDTSLAHRITNSQEYKDSCGYITMLHSQDSIDNEPHGQG